jgi:LPXTG-motif cell wall-anchored protein
VFGNERVQRIHRHLTRPLAAVAAAAATALLLARPVAAHLTAEPAFLAVGSSERIVLTVHNDREVTMTGFRLTVPAGFRIAAAGGDESWSAAVEGATASWTGGSLAAFRPTALEVELETAGVAPGPVVLRGDQLYADVETVSWPVTLTVVPAGSSPADDTVGATTVVILVVLGLLVVGTFGLVFWQRRRDPRLQER